MRIPITNACATVQGIPCAGGYVTVEMDEKMIPGKLTLMIAERVKDVEHDKVMILSRNNTFDTIKKASIAHLEKISDVEVYADYLEKMLQNIDNMIEDNMDALMSHQSTEYQWKPWANPAVTPETWLSGQCSEMRKQGLVMDVAGQTPSRSLLNSMGSDLVRHAKSQGLLP